MVEVIDNIVPTITCPSDTIVLCNVDFTPNVTGLPIISDNCSIAMTAYGDSISNVICANSYTINREWTTFDNSSLTSSCIQIIEILDTVAPVLSSINDTVVYCDAPYYPESPSFSDACGTAFVVRDSTIISNGCVGNYTVIYNYIGEDECGNKDSIQTQVTVRDTTPPNFQISPNTLDSLFLCADELEVPKSPIASDNCGNVVTSIYSDDTLSFSCSNNFERLIIWEAMDGCGNSAFYTALLTVRDTIGPIIQNALDTSVVLWQ